MADAITVRAHEAAPADALQAEQGGYDPSRLRRASLLACDRLGPAQFRVAGQKEPFYDVDLTGDPMCYCEDHKNRGVQCKHILRARLASGDESLLLALGGMLLHAERNGRVLT